MTINKVLRSFNEQGDFLKIRYTFSGRGRSFKIKVKFLRSRSREGAFLRSTFTF